MCPGCKRDFRSWTRILKHLKVTPSCLEVAKLARQLGEIPSHGEGSRSWNADIAKNPAIAPACPRQKTVILYDDEDLGSVLPREKLVERCAADGGSVIDDWVQQGASPADVDAKGMDRLWPLVRSKLTDFPLFIEEHRQALGLVSREISLLYGVVLQWSKDCKDRMLAALDGWQEHLSYQDLVPEQPGDPDPRSHGHFYTYKDASLLHHEPFMFTREHVVAFLGDELPAEERTHLLTTIADRHLCSKFCGWSLPCFRGIEVDQLDAIPHFVGVGSEGRQKCRFWVEALCSRGLERSYTPQASYCNPFPLLPS